MTSIPYKTRYSILGALIVPLFGRIALHGTNYEYDFYRYFIPFIVGGISGFLIGLMKDKWLITKQNLVRTNKTMKQEIQEHKLSRQALQESNKRYRILSETLVDIVYEFDSKGKFTYVNEVGVQMFGYSKDEILKNLHAIDVILKEDYSRSKKAIGEIFTGKIIIAERTFLRKDGTVFIGEVHSGPIYKGKEIIGVRGVIRDISKRKQAEEEQEKLIDELQEALEDVKTLSGFLPICANCKKIRDDKGYWNQIEGYIQKHSEAQFSHGICPECSDKLYGKEDWYIKKKQGEK